MEWVIAGGVMEWFIGAGVMLVVGAFLGLWLVSHSSLLNEDDWRNR